MIVEIVRLCNGALIVFICEPVLIEIVFGERKHKQCVYVSCVGLLRLLSLRMRFVVNKWDVKSMVMGQDEAETKKYVDNLVNEQLSGEGFQLQLQPEQVCLAFLMCACRPVLGEQVDWF